MHKISYHMMTKWLQPNLPDSFTDSELLNGFSVLVSLHYFLVSGIVR